MTDKQIIIDGVDVSGCGWYTQGATGMICADWHLSNVCSKNPNCYYKQLLRKEQECEELKENLPNAITRLIGELDQLKAELEQYKDLAKHNGRVCNERLDKIDELEHDLNELKAENEILEKVNKANQEKIKKLNGQLEEEFISKQYGDEALFFTLMDIKEIAEKHAPRCAVSCPNDDYKCEICMLDDLKQILNKISEVINE